MAAVGIVAEYDPFHRGHRHHITETRRALGEDVTVICCMSGNFVQRGGCAIADKWRRAAWAVEGGADLVVELPTVWAASSAERFAFGGVSLLRAAGAEALSFGSETGDAAGIRRAAQCLAGEEYRAALGPLLDRGLPFAACRRGAVEAVLGPEGAALLDGPNDSLAAEYLKGAAKLDWSPRVVAVPRRGADHNGDHPTWPSASQLRREILAGERPLEEPASLSYNERGVLARLRALSPADFAALPDCGEGLDRRLAEAVRQGRSLEEVYALAKTKRYAHARIRRAVLWGALGLRAADRPPAPDYLRVLAMSRRGAAHLAGLRDRCPLPVVTKAAQHPDLLALEARCTDFYALCRRTPWPCGEEFRHSPTVAD